MRRISDHSLGHTTAQTSLWLGETNCSSESSFWRMSCAHYALRQRGERRFFYIMTRLLCSLCSQLFVDLTFSSFLFLVACFSGTSSCCSPTEPITIFKCIILFFLLQDPKVDLALWFCPVYTSIYTSAEAKQVWEDLLTLIFALSWLPYNVHIRLQKISNAQTSALFL